MLCFGSGGGGVRLKWTTKGICRGILIETGHSFWTLSYTKVLLCLRRQTGMDPPHPRPLVKNTSRCSDVKSDTAAQGRNWCSAVPFSDEWCRRTPLRWPWEKKKSLTYVYVYAWIKIENIMTYGQLFLQKASQRNGVSVTW